MAQDSSRPDFWDLRYRERVTPWDPGGAPAMLAEWLAAQPDQGRVLVPGCGSAHEVLLFAARGYDVVAIDFSDAALEAARGVLGARAGLARKADFFGFEGDDPAFDLLYERAFLCALPRRIWVDWAVRAARLVRPGGRLAGFFYFDDNAKGPPFGIARAALVALLAPAFDLVEDRAVPAGQSIPVFQDKERWMVWLRRAPRAD